MMGDYTEVRIDPEDRLPEEPDVRLRALGVNFTLPNLNGSKVPLEVMQAALLVTQGDRQDMKSMSAVLGTFLDYFKTSQPRLWKALKKNDHPIDWVGAIIRTWSERSKLDPKASSSRH